MSDTTVFAGGHFTTVNGETRTRLAAFDASRAALTSWAPTADKRVNAMVLTPAEQPPHRRRRLRPHQRRPQHGLSAVNVSDGSKGTFNSNDIPANSSTSRSWVTDIVSDGTRMYASANGEGTFDGRLAFNPDNGSRIWINNCLGATQAISVMGGVLYSGSHAHRCNMQSYYGGDGFPETKPHRRYLAEPTSTAQGGKQTILHWFPNSAPGTTTPGSRARGRWPTTAPTCGPAVTSPRSTTWRSRA